MVRGISGRVKRYVSVTARMDEDGRVRPLSIQWYDEQTYPVDDVLSVRLLCLALLWHITSMCPLVTARSLP